MQRIFSLFLISTLLCCLLSCDNSPDTKLSATNFQVLVVEQGGGKVSLYDNSSYQKLDSIELEFNPHEIEISADGKIAYITNFGLEDYDNTVGIPGTTISVIDLATFTLKDSFSTLRPSQDTSQSNISRAPHGIKLRPHNPTELFVNTERGDSMLVYNTESGQITNTFPVPEGTHNFIFSPSGDSIWLFAGALGVFCYDSESGEMLKNVETKSAVRGLAYTLDQRHMIVSGENEIYLLNPKTAEMDKYFTDLRVKQIIYSAPSPDGKYILAPCPYDSQVLIIDIETGKVEKRLATGRAPINILIAPDASKAFISNAMDQYFSVLDLSTYEIEKGGMADRPNGIHFVDDLGR